MTPLAAYLAKQIVARPKHREGIWREPENIKRLRGLMEDIHCFEVTAALPVAMEIHKSLKHRPEKSNTELFNTYSFLPAPKTWIEWKHASGNRIAIHIHDPYNGNYPEKKEAACIFFSHDIACNLGTVDIHGDEYHDVGGDRYLPTFLTDISGEQTPAILLSAAHFMLVLINSPRIIGRRQHMPNVGLERRLTRGLGVGKFPLHAWTEIRLEVAKPTFIDDGEPHEAHLTGRRALHFCRKHIRIRNGQLEYVSAHWRGDPALGIKRSRYTVTA
jgi:hypothetical protein